MADLLPAEVLRFLVIRPKPNTPVNFSADEEGIVKLFNDFDRFHSRVTREKNANDDETAVYKLSELSGDGGYLAPNFQFVAALVQLPHLNALTEIEKRAGRALTEADLRHVNRRIASARLWVEKYAKEEEKTRLQETLPARAEELSAAQRAFLHSLADQLPGTAWEDDPLQTKIFEAARMTPIDQPLAFRAIYRVLLDRDAGPKAGNLIAFLDADFVVKRFRELSFSRPNFWRETAITKEELAAWMEQNREKIAGIDYATSAELDLVSFETIFQMKDGKKQLKRVLLPVSQGTGGMLAILQPVTGGLTA